MAISLDKINNALDRLDNKGGGDRNQDSIVKLDEGEHQLRIAPYKEDMEMPFQNYGFIFALVGALFCVLIR